jgi:hypothetical protein
MDDLLKKDTFKMKNLSEKEILHHQWINHEELSRMHSQEEKLMTVNH